MSNIVTDVSELTNVSEKILEKLLNVAALCIGHNLHESLVSKQDTVVLDVGVGELILLVRNDLLQYKFIPCPSFEKMLARVVLTGQSPIAEQLESNLQQRIEQTYKELL